MPKTCPRCKQHYVFEKKYFHKNKLNKDGLTSVCKNCKKEEYEFNKSKNIKTFTKICEFNECKKEFTINVSFKKYCCINCRDKANKYKNGREIFESKRNFKIRFERKKENEFASNNNKRWTTEEIETLIDLREAKVPYKEISLRLKRKSINCSRKYFDIQSKIKSTNKLIGKAS